jgi:glycosyltransferase involved in cell wall biosynthesis
MRILMISKACLVGAYQTKLEAIAQADDLDLVVIVPPLWRDPAGDVELELAHTDGYDLVVDPIRFNGNYHFHYYPSLTKRIRQFRPDILHIDEEPYNLATWLAVRSARKFGCKSLFFSWQNINHRYPWPFRSMEQMVLSNVDYAIVGNRDSATVWREKGYRGNVQIIPQFGVSTDTCAKFARPRESETFVIGSAGRRIVWEKGNDLILKAAAGLPGKWLVRIAGEGPERSKLERLAEDLGIKDRVHFDGVIASEQMPAHLNKLDTLILASRTLNNWKEQFGRILVEGMACEVPVIGSDSGEIPNVIGQAGLIFPEDDVLALQRRLMDLMEDSQLRHNLGQAGRQRVLAFYTQERVASNTVAVYQEMMG